MVDIEMTSASTDVIIQFCSYLSVEMLFPFGWKVSGWISGYVFVQLSLFFTNLINKSILCMVFMTFLRIAVTLYIQKHYISRNFLFFLNISAHSFGLHWQTDVATGISFSLRVRVRVLSCRSTYTRQLDYQSVPGRIQQPMSCDTSSWRGFIQQMFIACLIFLLKQFSSLSNILRSFIEHCFRIYNHYNHSWLASSSQLKEYIWTRITVIV